MSEVERARLLEVHFLLKRKMLDWLVQGQFCFLIEVLESFLQRTVHYMQELELMTLTKASAFASTSWAKDDKLLDRRASRRPDEKLF